MHRALASLAPYMLAESSFSQLLEIGVQQMSTCGKTEAYECRGGLPHAYGLRIGVLMSPQKSVHDWRAGPGERRPWSTARTACHQCAVHRALASLAPPYMLAKSSFSQLLEIGVQQMSICSKTEAYSMPGTGCVLASLMPPQSLRSQRRSQACHAGGLPLHAYGLRIGVLMSPQKSVHDWRAGPGERRPWSTSASSSAGGSA